MTIEKDLPFDICESCSECILDVNEQILFSYGESCQRVVKVGCKNANLCKVLRKKQEENHASEK